jgi:cadmium resistance transport/sequestration family protein
MGRIIEVIIAAIASFAATNLDDIIVLMVFFAQINSTFRRRHIILGQYLGFTAIIIASLPGFFGGLIVSKVWIGLLGFIPIIIGISRWFNRGHDNQIQAISDELSSNVNPSMVSMFGSIISYETYQMAGVTFANGGDNITIYIPLFASGSLVDLGITVSVFFILIGVWCYVAYQLSLHSAIARILTKYGHAIVPFVLIGLGIFILIESGTYRLLRQ